MINDEGLCTCDAFDQAHEPGLIVGDTYCERLYTEPTISPHRFGVPPDVGARWDGEASGGSHA